MTPATDDLRYPIGAFAPRQAVTLLTESQLDTSYRPDWDSFFPGNACEIIDQQSVVTVQRRTETGDAPGCRGATRENTGSI